MMYYCSCNTSMISYIMIYLQYLPELWSADAPAHPGAATLALPPALHHPDHSLHGDSVKTPLIIVNTTTGRNMPGFRLYPLYTLQTNHCTTPTRSRTFCLLLGLVEGY